MSDRWAVRVPRPAAAAALPLRLRGGVEACGDGEALWLKGGGALGDVLPLLRRIPGARVFAVDPAGRITSLGRRIPEGVLPDGPWVPFASAVRLRPQPAALPAPVERKVHLRLARSEGGPEPGAMVLPVGRWARYAASAPQVRLDVLRFAVCGDGRALVLGRPLPPVPADGYLADHQGLLVPCGYDWHPRVEPAVLRRAMGLADDDLAILAPGGGYERVRGDALVRATRSAARASGSK